MKNFIKIFIIFSSILNLQLYSSAPLTQENLRRKALGLPLNTLPKNNQFLQQKRKPLTRKQRYELGVSYLRALRAAQTKKVFQSKYTPYTHYEQEKLKRYPGLHEYQTYLASIKKSSH